MRELVYTLLELQKEFRNTTCDFCSGYGKDNKSVKQIRSHIKVNDEYVGVNVVCEDYKEKFESDELPKCQRCGRLQTILDINAGCYYIRRKENLEEKELPNLPNERESTFAYYERQINTLQEELTAAEWTINEEQEAHEDFMEKSEEWSKRQKQELLHRIKELEMEVERLKKLTPQELINEVESYKKEVAQLKTQLEKLNSQQIAQIEVRKWPWLKVRK
jgi:DNA repair exonuclease SbcCD ATPase subunit